MRLSNNKKAILKALRYAPQSAEAIGQRAKGKNAHWAKPHLDFLVKHGCVRRTDDKHYELTEKGVQLI